MNILAAIKREVHAPQSRPMLLQPLVHQSVCNLPNCFTEEQLLDLAEFERSTHFNEREKRALRLTVALTRTPAEVPDELFAVLRGEFSERELVELTNAIAWENYRARFNRTFAIESENFSKGQFCPLPER